jgi:hypothetical protein
MGAHQGVTGYDKWIYARHGRQIQPGPGRGGEPDAVVLHQLAGKERQKVSHDVESAGDAETGATGNVDAPVILKPPH